MNRQGVLTCGYIGFGNLGDEAVHLGLIGALRSQLPEHPIRVMSGSPEQSQLSLGCEAVPRMQMQAVWQAMRRSSLFVLGGGSLFQDVTSVRNSVYYGLMAMMARRAGCKVLWSGQGIGPIRREWLGRWIAGLAAQADSVVLRDSASAQLLSGFGYKKAVGGADLAFLMPSEPAQAQSTLFGVAPRITPSLSDEFWQLLMQVLSERLPKHGLTPLYIAMQPNEDAPLCQKLHEQLPGELLLDAGTAPEVLRAIGRCQAMLAVRLHALILGAVCGVPSVGVGYDPKVCALWQPAFPELLVTPQDVSRLKVEDALDTLLADTAGYRARVRDFTLQQRELAQRTLHQQLCTVV